MSQLSFLDDGDSVLAKIGDKIGDSHRQLFQSPLKFMP